MNGTIAIVGRPVRPKYPDDQLLKLGTDNDIVMLLRSATLSANEELTGVIVGTSVHPATAANTLIISNITSDGDILILANDGGNSKAAILIDAASPAIYFYSNTTFNGNITLGDGTSIAKGTGYTTDFIIRTANLNDYFAMFGARDTDNAIVEVARLQGAADPYFQLTLPSRLNPSSTPGTLVEGHFWYGSSEDALRYRDASATKYVSENVLIATGSLTAGAAGAKIFGWQNTRVSGAVIVLKILINITTASTAAATINVGQAATDTTSDNLLDGGALDAVDTLNNVDDKGTNGALTRLVADDAYVTGYEGTGSLASTDLVGTYTIFYMPV